MPEGLSADEVGKEITEHAKETGEEHPDALGAPRLDRRGRPARDRGAHGRLVGLRGGAKWSSESRVKLAEASTLRSEANRADINSIDRRNFDGSTLRGTSPISSPGRS